MGRDFLVSRDIVPGQRQMGQKSLHCPGTKGQLDKFKILPQGRKFDVLLGQDFDSMSLPGISWDSHGNERGKEFKKLQFWKKFICFNFLTFFCQSDFLSRDRGVFPGFLLFLLSQDKGTVGQGNCFDSFKGSKVQIVQF